MSAYLTVDQVADDLQLSPNTIRNWVRSGKLPAYKLGTGVTAPLRIRQSDVDTLLDAGKVAPR
ncbi:helix-turn-helix domain-containing protein [Rhodococcoides fascians]|uniref:helix-turn-helix domain-containing protein n=1 Tax=Rhodococcoides fascians TaxID=1828 RepID=UPI00050CF073|nr:helix-turn-helix domain-containing protein [Rhodococcus fascians]